MEANIMLLLIVRRYRSPSRYIARARAGVTSLTWQPIVRCNIWPFELFVFVSIIIWMLKTQDRNITNLEEIDFFCK